MKRSLAMCGALLALLSGEVRAGTNIFPDREYRVNRKDGCQVRCTATGCRHGCDRLSVTRYGMRYDVRYRVVPRRRGLGVKVQVTVRSADGNTHGLFSQLNLYSQIYHLPPRFGRLWLLSGLGLFGGTSRAPLLRPGQTRVVQSQWPGGRGDGVTKGHRLVLPVQMSHVRPAGWTHAISPKVATVVLTVPFRGRPRVRIRAVP